MSELFDDNNIFVLCCDDDSFLVLPFLPTISITTAVDDSFGAPLYCRQKSTRTRNKQ